MTELRATVLRQRQHGRGFTSHDLFDQLGLLDPFLSLTDFHMPLPYFPPHPHAGFSVMTYMFEDSPGAFVNRDSFGDHSRVEPGALHWTQAGRGIQHEEVPERPGVDGHGLQMWIDHAREDRWVEPAVHHVSAVDVPEVDLGAAGKIRVLVGRTAGVSAAFAPLVAITLLDVALSGGSSFEHNRQPGEMGLAFILEGAGEVSDATGAADVEAHWAVRVGDESGPIRVRAAAGGVRALVGAGRPLGGPTVFGGTFVMSSEEELSEADRRYRAGEMGLLAPSVDFG